MLRNIFRVNIFIISDPAQKEHFLGLKKENFIKTKVTTIKREYTKQLRVIFGLGRNLLDFSSRSVGRVYG